MRPSMLLVGLCVGLPWLCVAVRGVPDGHDLELELIRVAAYGYAVADGQWPPYWAGELYAGFGSAAFLFYGHVCLAVSSVFALITRSFAAAWILCLASFSALAAVSLYRLGALAAPGPSREAAGRIAVYAFVLNPYLLGDVFARNAGAEFVALCTMPLAFLGLLLTARGDRGGPLVLALGTGLVTAAHNLSALVLVTLLLVLALGTSVCWRTLARQLWGLGLGLAAAAFHWLPALLLKDEIRSEDLLTGKFDYSRQFRPVASYFELGEFYSAGPLPLVAAAAGVAALMQRGARASDGAASPWDTRHMRWLSAWLFVMVALAGIQLRAAGWLWSHVPLLPYFQFPWRFMGPLALASAVVGSIAFARLAQLVRPTVVLALEAIVLVAVVVCALPQLLGGPVLSDEAADRMERRLALDVFRATPYRATVGHEYLPKTARLGLLTRPAHGRPVLLASEGVTVAVRRDTPRWLELTVHATAPGELCLARWSFPWWQVHIDGQLQASGGAGPGCVAVKVLAGTHRVVARVAPPSARQVGLMVSLVALLTGLLSLLRMLRKSR